MELIRNAYARAVSVLNLIAPLGDLAIRLWVAIVFFKSGLTKLDNWDGTLYLFQNEYHVPLLPPELAAYLGTANCSSLCCLRSAWPRASRPSCCSCSTSLLPRPPRSSGPRRGQVGLNNHETWGLLLLVPLLHGAGKISLDFFLEKKFAPRH